MNQNKIKKSFFQRLSKDLVRNKGLYIMILPIVIYYIIFHYYPMYGAQIAFKDFKPVMGIEGSPWVGLKHIKLFFKSIYAKRLIVNTLSINLKNLIFGFPAPIILALLLNEVKSLRYKKLVQTITYLPHFISTVVICGMVVKFVATNGIITYLLTYLGFAKQNLMYNAEYFQPIYVISDIWTGIGWNSIIYIAAITGINGELYEAARIDGAGKWKQTWHVTLPSIIPTIVTLLVMRIGSMMSLGFEKVFLLYNEAIYEKADIISTYVYRKGIEQMNYSFSTAIGLFNSVINLLLLVGANKLSKKCTESSLW